MLAENGCATSGARVLVMGVTYKPDVADVRESPALEIIDELAAAGARVAFYRPVDRVAGHRTRRTAVSSPGRPEKDTWDLVLVHTRHADVDHAWLAAHPTVLDTTYRS